MCVKRVLVFVAGALLFSACGGPDFKSACDRWQKGSGESYRDRAAFAEEMSGLTDGRLSEDFEFLERTMRALAKGDVDKALSYELQTKISEQRINERMLDCPK